MSCKGCNFENKIEEIFNTILPIIIMGNMVLLCNILGTDWKVFINLEILFVNKFVLASNIWLIIRSEVTYLEYETQGTWQLLPKVVLCAK